MSERATEPAAKSASWMRGLLLEFSKEILPILILADFSSCLRYVLAFLGYFGPWIPSMITSEFDESIFVRSSLIVWRKIEDCSIGERECKSILDLSIMSAYAE